MDREALESLEWLVGAAEDLNRDVAAATGDPTLAHAGAVLALTFLAATGPVDRDRLTGFLDLLEVDATAILDLLAERGLADVTETEGVPAVVLTSAGRELFETMADTVGGSQSENLSRMRHRHLPR